METLNEYIVRHRKNKEKADDFITYLYELMDKYSYDKNSDLYKKAGISRQNWSSIISNKSKPSLNTVIRIAFALRVKNHECKYLIKKAGFSLSSNSEYALIIRYCI